MVGPSVSSLPSVSSSEIQFHPELQLAPPSVIERISDLPLMRSCNWRFGASVGFQTVSVVRMVAA